MSKSDILISVQKIGVRFKSSKSIFNRSYIEALSDVSFELRRVDSLGIIGRNGAVKSTLLQLLGGIIMPDKGRIINNDVSTSLLALALGFDGELSGRANIVISGMFLGFSKKEVESNMEKIIAFSELGSFIDQPVKTYSAGMRARLGFSITLELNPDVLLIDETLGVGDVQFRKKSVAVMREKLLSDQTIVLVSHDAHTVKKLCNRAVWVEDGITRMEGSVDKVITSYERFLAENKPRTDGQIVK